MPFLVLKTLFFDLKVFQLFQVFHCFAEQTANNLTI